MIFLGHLIKKEISRRIKGTKIREKHPVSYLMSVFKWIAEHGVGITGIIYTLLRAIKDRNIWRVIIVHDLNEQDKLKKKENNYWGLEIVIPK